MAKRAKIIWNNSALENALSELFDECRARAERIKATADSMRTSESIAEYNVSEGHGPGKYKYAGGRPFVMVSADAPSTIADEARTNALNKAAGSC